MRAHTRSVIDDSGAGTVVGVGFISLTTALLGLVVSATSLAVEQVRLQSITDQIALMAEDAQRGLITGFPCEVAQTEASRFALTLDTCRILNSETWIVLKSDRLGIVMTAKAHSRS